MKKFSQNKTAVAIVITQNRLINIQTKEQH